MIGVMPSSAARSLDGPADNATLSPPFLAGGWAIDTGATSGTGVDAIHVWAFRIVNGVPSSNGQFVAQGTAGGSRPDVGAVYGSRVMNSGYTFVIGNLAPGEYMLGVYARSPVSGTFNNAKFVRITIQ